MNNVWVICDLHLWTKEYNLHHPFKTDIEIRKWIDGFAQCTHDSDVILFLGDMGDPEVMEFQKLKDFLSNISGYKILCKGNHDTEDDTYYEDAGFDKVCEVAVLYSIVFSHIPVKLLPDQLNVHAHLHYEKDSRLNYQYINAFDFYQDHKPMLLDDILEQAAVRLPEAKENPVLEKYQTYAGPKDYQNILDISDMIQLFPMDEAVKINTFSLQELNKVQTPDELQKWMRRFIHYANYSVLKSPEQVLSSGSGSCHDQVAFEFPRLVKMNLNPKILFLITYKEGENVGGMTHSLCYWVDEDNGSCTWFENAWQGAQGIHKFKSLDDLKMDIKNRYARMPQSQNFPEIEFRSTSINNFKPGVNLDTLVRSVFKSDSINESAGNIASINTIDDDYINSCIAVEIIDKRGMEPIALNHIRDCVTTVLKHFHPILKDTYHDQILIDNSAQEIQNGYKKPLFFTSTAYPGEDINIFHVLQRDKIPHDIDYTNLVSSSVCYGIILQVMKTTWKKEIDPMLAAAISFCIWNWGITDLISTFDPSWKQWFAESGEVLIERCHSVVQIEKDYGIGGIYLLTTGQLDLNDCMLSEAIDKMEQPLDEILFEDPTDTELWEQDDNYNPAHKKKELRVDGLGDTKNEAAIKFVNDKGEKVPTVCPKCGSKVGVFLRGEPVFLCTNKKCEKYFGTVPFNLDESVRDDAKSGKPLNIYMIFDHPKDDELISAGKSFGADITAAVRNFKFRYCRADDNPRVWVEKDPPEIAYVHMPEPGYYDFRYSDEDPDSWWSMQDVNLRMVGVIKFDKDWSWKLDDSLNEAVAETHQLDREQQEKVAAKYGLRNPGHDLTPAEERVNEERDKRKEYLKKARKIKKRKAFVRKLKSKIPGIKNEDSAVDNDAQSYENPDLDVGPFTSEVRFYNRIHEYPNEAVSILSNADIQFKSIQEFVDYFNTRQNQPEPFIGESYKFELEDKNLHFNTNMNLTEAASPNEKLYPVYIMLQHSGTLLANMIKGVTQSHFSHSSISFDSSMRNMYSFGRKSDTNPFIGAFKKEDIHSKFFTDRTIPYALYVVPCTQEQVKLMKKRLDYFIQNSTKFKYDFTGLLKNYLGIADNPEYKWFCSRFVADIINAGSPQEHPYVVEPSLMKPEDFQYTNFAIYVTGGYLNSYDSNFVDKVTNRILRTERIRRAKEAATNKEYLENLPIAESVFDLDPLDPYQELVTNYQLGMLQESVVDSFIQYLQSFKIKFEKDGSIRLTRREYDQLDQHFKQSLRNIKAFEKTDNLEGVKGELCKIYYMIELINRYYLSPKVKSSNRVKANLKKQMMDLRSVLMNVFKQHLKYVTVREPQFNFQTYYDHSKYGKDIEIPKAVLSDVGKALITKL